MLNSDQTEAREMLYLIGDVVWPSLTSASELKDDQACVSVDDGRQTYPVPNLAPEEVERMVTCRYRGPGVAGVLATAC